MLKKNINFDEFSENYRKIHNKNIGFSGASSEYFSYYKIAEIKKAEKNNPIKKILDLGCGDGISCIFFQKNFPDAEIMGIDVSKESIRVALEKKMEKCSFAVYDGKNIPSEDNCFDIVFIACVLHHIPIELHARLIKESCRVLKPSGKIYLFEHNPANPITKRAVDTCSFDEGAVLLPKRYSEKLLRENGFKKIKSRYTIFFPRFVFFKPFLFLEKYLSRLPFGGQYYIQAVK